jgi:phosphatidate cytidylyltransferase
VRADRGRAQDTEQKHVSPSREFWARIASALVLAAGAITLTWAGVRPFLLLVAGCLAVLAWEWSRITRSTAPGRDAVLQAGAAITGAVLAGNNYPVASLGLLGVCALMAALLAHESRLGPGIVYLGLPSAAVAFIRSDAAFGFEAIMFLLLVIWCADTMAYVAGKLIGGAKLAPAISPGKTLSGSAAGILFPALLGFFYCKWLGGTAPVMLALVAAVLAIVSQIGDLAESAVKRAAGVKDASHLIPGHGGLLDRLDAFLFAATAAGALALLRNADHPGKALLIWQ